MTNQQRMLIRASGFYLTQHLTLELIEGDESDLTEFIGDHLWEPFENWPVEDVYELISELADSFEELIV